MRTIATVILTAIVTAIVTSGFWIMLYGNPKMQDAAATASPSSQSGRTDVPPAPTVAAEATINELPQSVPATGPSGEASSTGRIGIVPEDLVAKRLTMPVSRIDAEALTPVFYDARGARGHEAIDIFAPKGRPVVAVEDGKIAKLFTSERGGLTIYQFDPTEKYSYYYAHLDRYAEKLTEGTAVKRGQLIAYVGTTGNAAATQPHLHFAIFLLGPEKKWWDGVALDPYPVLTRR